MKYNITVLASGTGTTLKNIIENIKEGKISGIVRCVITNNSKAGALGIAKENGIPYYVLKKEKVFEVADKFETDLMLLAGYTLLLKIPPHYENRILNIHPSLLPDFGGKGFYGIHVHRAVLDAQKLESGCTVHIVDNEYDNGPILAQDKVKVLENDTPESLQKRVQEAERKLYPKVVEEYINLLREKEKKDVITCDQTK